MRISKRNRMNWKLIFLLSVFGIFMAFGTVFWIPASIEPFVWLLIFILYAWIIAKYCSSGFFLHGFILSLVNSLWSIPVHIYFYGTYIFRHLDQISQFRNIPFQSSPKLLIFFGGLILGIVYGLIIGLLSVLASKVVKRQPSPLQNETL